MYINVNLSFTVDAKLMIPQIDGILLDVSDWPLVIIKS